MARTVRLAGITLTPRGSAEGNLSAALEMVERAGVDRPDLIALPETFTGLGMDRAGWLATAEAVPGPTTELLAERARALRCNIVFGLLQSKGRHLHNAAVILGRGGEVAGVYHKMRPTDNEIKGGVTPGRRAPVVQLDIGRVACAICFDLNFPEVLAAVRRGRPELIVFPSMFRGGLMTRSWAFACRCHFLSATTQEGSVLVDPLGRVLAASQCHAPVISRQVNLDCRVLHIDYNTEKAAELKRKYGPRARLDVLSPEAVMLLTSCHPKVSADQMMREFGLRSADDYLERSARLAERALGRGRRG